MNEPTKKPSKTYLQNKEKIVQLVNELYNKNTPKFQEKERGRAHQKPKKKNEALINVSLKKILPTKRHFEMLFKSINTIVDQYAYLNGRSSSY